MSTAAEAATRDPAEQDLIDRIAGGFTVESEDDMTPGYKRALLVQLTVQGDTELLSAPAYYLATRDAPTINSRIAVTAIVHDELGHANIAYRLMEDLGVDKQWLLFGRKPHEFKHPYGFDQPLENWAEMAVANGFFDRAGITLLSDVHEHTSYGPLRRALVKVDREEVLHLRHGESWMKRLAKAGGAARDALQRAVDWMFPMTLEWFGLPDELKRHSDQLTYRLKGKSNDELRQVWMSATVPLCEGIGIEVPAHHDATKNEYVIDYPFPCHYDPEAKRWLFDEPLTWEQVFDRWKARGPMNQRYVEMIQGRADGPFGGRRW
ncbi:MAG: phenylacetic acid catabolic [Gemmatimonadetes bacterium RBG_16_66_8]|nr:MAG: phenylacetic acid catabolic [Gemmatimonadetes bacterium RBG_16_66_8]